MIVDILPYGQNVQGSLHSVHMASDVDENIRKNLFRIMKELNLNQTQFGLKVGVDVKYLNKILKEKRAMGKPTLERVAKVLNIGVEELLKNEQQKPAPPLPYDEINEMKKLIREADEIGEGQAVREKALEYISLLVRDAKKKETPGPEGTKGGLSRRRHKRAG